MVTSVSRCICRDHRTTGGSWISSSTMWDPEVKLGSLGLTASPFPPLNHLTDRDTRLSWGWRDDHD